jgi:hypothetical protein
MCSPPAGRVVVPAIDVSGGTVSVPDVRPGGSREPSVTESMLLGVVGCSLIGSCYDHVNNVGCSSVTRRYVWSSAIVMSLGLL